jgi:multiple sugar transport system substrate-binding protein
MRVRTILLAAALMLVPLGVRAADLVVWWEESFYPEEDQATRELVAAFEAETSKTVALIFLPQSEVAARVEAALAAGRPPDLLRGDDVSLRPEQWAAAGALADLSDVVLPIKDRFFPGLLDFTFLRDARTDHLTPFTVPLGQAGIYLHVWTSLLQRAGLQSGVIPREWEAFWSFWCDTAQPAVRKALGRDDIWGLGLAMSPVASDTSDVLAQFMIARSAYFWPGSGRSLDEQPAFRANLIGALADYTAPWRKGCVPPDAVRWTNSDNNKAFLDQRVLMTPNPTLSIAAALRATRPADYYGATATIDWPAGADGRIFPLLFFYSEAVVFDGAPGTETAKDLLRFLLRDGRLGVWLEAAQGRWLPSMPELTGSPFWMNPVDPHQRPAVERLVGPSMPKWGPARAALSLRWDQSVRDRLFGGAVIRIAVDGLTPEQAADELIIQLRQLQSE